MEIKLILLACLVAYVYSDATSDVKAKATDCKNFFELCAAGCKGGWGAGCGGGPGRWGPSTKCDCQKWGGVRPPKQEQSKSAFLDEIYAQHNRYRTQHKVPSARRDAKAEQTAQAWADKLASTDTFKHNQNRNGFGENIYYSSGIVEGKDAVDAWYDEVNDPGYNFRNQGFSSGTGHFTQVVWKASTGVGCGRATSRSKKTYVVCNYNPAGNMQGAFEKNVFPK